MTIRTLCAFLTVTAPVAAFLSPFSGSYELSTKLMSHDESISRLLQEYRDLQSKLSGEKEINLLRESIDLQEQLRGELQENRNVSASHDVEALLQKEVELNALEVEDMRAKAQLAQKERVNAFNDAQKAHALKRQAEEEAQWALDEVVLLESMGSQNEELEDMLLAQAAHDLKETSDLVMDVDKCKSVALQREIHVKDLLWYLVQREENLKRLQTNHSQGELEEWAEKEQPRLESIVQMLRRKLIEHNPDKDTVSF